MEVLGVVNGDVGGLGIRVTEQSSIYTTCSAIARRRILVGCRGLLHTARQAGALRASPNDDARRGTR